MILSAQSIRARVTMRGDLVIDPFCERTVECGMSYGLSACGYDIRIAGGKTLEPGAFALATTVEYIAMPPDLMGQLADKSSWARRAVAVQNTVFEPGWRGYPTIELTNHGHRRLHIPSGAPIGQMIFLQLDAPTESPYEGKYQDQPQEPVPAKSEDA